MKEANGTQGSCWVWMLEKKKGKRGKFDIEATMKYLSEESIAKERILD